VPRLATFAAIYVAAIAGARALGFVRETLIAYFFGTSFHTDAYLAATAVPELAAGILAAGVFTYMLVPALVRFNQAGQTKESDELVGVVLTQVLTWGGAAVVLSLVFARPLMHVVAPGLGGVRFAEALRLFRLTCASSLFFAVAGVAGAMLNARSRFLPIPIALIFGNVVGISILLAAPELGINAAAFGYLGTAIATAALQWLALRRLGIRPRLRWGLGSANVRAALFAGSLAFGAASTAYVRPFIERLLATTLPPGELAALGFATKLVFLVGVLLAAAIGTLAFPGLTAEGARPDLARFTSLLRRATTVVVALSLPVALAMIVFPRPIVHLVFSRGAFGVTSVVITASALRAFSLSLVAICMNEILVRGLFALRQERLVAIVWTLALALNAAVDVAAIKLGLGVRGLGYGAAVALWLNAIAMGAALYRLLRRDAAGTASAETA
jgi:putative peptidoglycan lipid II flippase